MEPEPLADANRQQFLDAKFQESALKFIKTCTSSSSELDVDDLKIAKTAVGALLNSCYGFGLSIYYHQIQHFNVRPAPARSCLISLGAPAELLALSTTLYPPAHWANKPEDAGKLEDLIALYQIRIGLADWSWRVLSAINEGGACPSSTKHYISYHATVEKSPLGTESIRSLLSTFSGFIPGQPDSSPLVQHSESRNALVEADLESLEECVSLLEALSLDSEDFRLAFLNDEATLISPLLDFIEKGDYPEYWKLDGEEESKKRERTFDVCKAGTIKALISVAGDTQSMEILWGQGDALITRLVTWIKGNSSTHRDDLVIAGCLTLGNLARKGRLSSPL
jgi:hypothetical protein